jgi:hypothetical protein
MACDPYPAHRHDKKGARLPKGALVLRLMSTYKHWWLWAWVYQSIPQCTEQYLELLSNTLDFEH